MAGEFGSAGFRKPSFIDDLARGEAYTPPRQVEDDGIGETLQERDATRAAFRNVITDALAEETPANDVSRERGLYEDLTIRDRSRSRSQSRIIGGMPPWGHR